VVAWLKLSPTRIPLQRPLGADRCFAGEAFAITETKKFEFRGEIFNLLNHPVFAAPGTNIDQSSGG